MKIRRWLEPSTVRCKSQIRNIVGRGLLKDMDTFNNNCSLCSVLVSTLGSFTIHCWLFFLLN